MSKAYPDSIPVEFEKHADLESAYRRGWNHGHGIACHNVPKLGAKLFVEGIGRVTVDSENIREVHQALCYEAETNSRCYSPFEFTAHEFNSADPESLMIECEDGEWFVSHTDGPLDQAFKSEASAQAWIDAQPDSEQLWEAFESGANAAIVADLAGYTDADYGLED